ncbi:hypothetical protein, TraK family (plasmid) [Campylobacter iguaniorum]|uniref:TraK N-terminal domain-containing protein n=1 Tax=Campylobacter iguaniorum TaxID=1244531 RepID=A0A076FCG7_9BACT|nr:type-F conjugative transfer system secretin TraK [Campylobacter iguaniorum]AII15631.1 hypothetical protein, TraK family [Campylobacter iguaniorum]
MRKMLLMLLMATAQMFAVTVIDNPTSETITINVSNKSVNRIVLPSKILDVAYSKEKGVDIKIADNQAFVKYVPIQKEQVQVIAKDKVEKIGEPEIIYDKAKPSEVFFVTEGKTYAFALNPQEIEAETIIVNDFSKRAEEIVKYETDDTYISTLAKISQLILKGGSPQGYKVKQVDNLLSDQADLKIKEITTYEGVIYTASLVEVSNKTDKPKKLNPKEYIKYANGTPKAITAYYDNEVNYLLPFGKAYVVIVTKVEK